MFLPVAFFQLHIDVELAPVHPMTERQWLPYLPLEALVV